MTEIISLSKRRAAVNYSVHITRERVGKVSFMMSDALPESAHSRKVIGKTLRDIACTLEKTSDAN